MKIVTSTEARSGTAPNAAAKILRVAARATRRPSLIAAEPAGTGDDHWDALLAGITEWLAVLDGFPVSAWAGKPERTLSEPWSPHRLASLRQLAADNAPPEIRRHGVLIDPYDLARA